LHASTPSVSHQEQLMAARGQMTVVFERITKELGKLMIEPLR
jgi:hypothetical protein